MSDKRQQLLFRLLPFLVWAGKTDRRSLSSDIIAGLTGAVVVLPQGVAYALIAGLPPEYGLYTAIITPVIAGLFGSSLHLISGPTAAISIVVLSVVSSVVPPDSSQFIPMVMTLTLLAGAIQLGLGLARLGGLVNFISHTVVIGFTAGAAILIATSQIKYILGVSVASGLSFVSVWAALVEQLPATNGYTVAIAAATILMTLLVRKISPKLPAMLCGMTAGALVCWVLDGADNGVVLVGALPQGLPGFALPDIGFDTLTTILPGAMAVAILGLVEAVSIARAIAIHSGQRIDGNQEFVGQGLSNMVGSLFSCYAGSGSFTRTGVNYDAGAASPLAAVFAALFLLMIILFVPDITAYLPLAAMGGAILLVAWNLIDVHHIRQIIASDRKESLILLATFLSTLVVELEFAIYMGVILSLIIYLRRVSQPRVMAVAPRSLTYGTDLRSIERFGLPTCPQVKLIRIDGSMFFGAVDHIQKALAEASLMPEKHILVICSGVNYIDLAAAEMLATEVRRLDSHGKSLSFCALKNTVKDELQQAGHIDRIGTGRFYDSVDDALEAIQSELDLAVCQGCDKRIFRQCP
ncbi:MAG: SulP family inorganic anion transporter [Amphritea sp.]|nr:SulP family inorganic anion transporter [Amphritea sp.]